MPWDNQWQYASNNAVSPYYMTLGNTATVNAYAYVMPAMSPTVTAPPSKPAKHTDDTDPIRWLKRRVDELLWTPA